MISFGEHLAWQLEAFRERAGETVTFNGNDYTAFHESTSGAVCGVAGLPTAIRQNLEVYIASLDPSIFVFSPQDFMPVTDVLAPVQGDTLIWHSMTYLVTFVSFSDMTGDTLSILVYCLRLIW